MLGMQLISREGVAAEQAATYRKQHYVLERYHVYPHGIGAAIHRLGEPTVEVAHEGAINLLQRYVGAIVALDNVIAEVISNIPIFI